VPAVFTGLIVGHVKRVYVSSAGKPAAMGRYGKHFLVGVIIIVKTIVSHTCSSSGYFKSSIPQETVSIQNVDALFKFGKQI